MGQAPSLRTRTLPLPRPRVAGPTAPAWGALLEGGIQWVWEGLPFRAFHKQGPHQGEGAGAGKCPSEPW